MITGATNHPLSRAVCWCLCIFLVCIQAVPSPASASFISSVPMETGDSNDIVADSLQADLERKLVAEQLLMLGLSSEEIEDKLKSLSDEECHVIASKLEGLQIGGDWLGDFNRAYEETMFFLGVVVLICALAFWLF